MLRSPLPNLPNTPWPNLVFSCLLGGFLFLTVTQTWNYPLLTTLLLTLALFAQWRFHPHPQDLKAMITAALLGTPAEAISVYLGEWQYHNIDLILGLPIWIPLIWANLFALYRRLTRTILALHHQKVEEGSETLTHLNMPFKLLAIGIATYGFSAIALMNKIPIVYLLYAGFLITMAGYWHQKEDLLIFLISALLGTLGEFVCVQLGYWSYYQPYFHHYGVDITLSLDWGLSAVIINRIANHRPSITPSAIKEI